MTSDVSHATGLGPGWFVHTDAGVTLSPCCKAREAAQLALWDVVGELRKEMVRSGRTRSAIEEHVGAVHVGYGVLVGAWGAFEAGSEPG